MCDLLGVFEGKSFKGYKIAVEIEGKFYSPFTGIEYKVGKVPTVKIPEISWTAWKPNKIMLNPHWNKSYKGYTSLFRSLVDAQLYYSNKLNYHTHDGRVPKKVVYLEFEISKDLRYSEPEKGINTIAGKYINSIKKI